MILIPEQISYLRQQVATTKQNLRSYNDYLDSKDITSGDYSARALIGDLIINMAMKDKYIMRRCML